MHPIRWRVVADMAAVVLAACLFSLPSFLNGYPFLHNDSGFYILHGTLGAPPGAMLWPPLTYSLCLKALLSMGGTLYFIFIQNLALSLLLFALLMLVRSSTSRVEFLGVALGLGLTSFLPTSNFIMTDVFAGAMVLSFAGMLLTRSWPGRLPWCAVFAFTAAMHYSNLLLATVMLLGAAAYERRARVFLPLGIVPWLAVAAIHFAVTDRFFVSNSHDVYIFSQLTTLGVAREHVAARCATDRSAFAHLCEHPEAGFHIWDWGSQSRIGLTGGLPNLLPDIAKANREILGGPLLFEVLWRSLGRVGRQVVTFARPLEPAVANAYLEGELGLYSPEELNYFRAQRLRLLSLESVMESLTWLYGIVSVLAVVLLWSLRRRLSEPTRKIFYIALAAYAANAAICAFLTEVDSRYSSRLVWIFPLLLWIHSAEQWRSWIGSVHLKRSVSEG